MLIANPKQQTERREAELEKMRAENQKLRGVIEYIAVCDYPEIFDNEEEEVAE